MNKTQLRDAAGISGNVIAKLGKNEPVSLESLLKIAETLDVDIGDIISLEKSNVKNERRRLFACVRKRNRID